MTRTRKKHLSYIRQGDKLFVVRPSRAVGWIGLLLAIAAAAAFFAAQPVSLAAVIAIWLLFAFFICTALYGFLWHILAFEERFVYFGSFGGVYEHPYLDISAVQSGRFFTSIRMREKKYLFIAPAKNLRLFLLYAEKAGVSVNGKQRSFLAPNDMLKRMQSAGFMVSDEAAAARRLAERFESVSEDSGFLVCYELSPVFLDEGEQPLIANATAEMFLSVNSLNEEQLAALINRICGITGGELELSGAAAVNKRKVIEINALVNSAEQDIRLPADDGCALTGLIHWLNKQMKGKKRLIALRNESVNNTLVMYGDEAQARAVCELCGYGWKIAQ